MLNLFERELLRRLPSYRKAELIDDESARKLGTHLTAQIESPNRLFVQAVYAVGSALIIASGVIAVIHNWNSIGHEMRLLLAFMPLLFAAIFGGFVLKIDAAQTWKELSALLNITGVAVMIGVIGQEYKIIAPTENYWLAGTLLSLPTVFIFNSGLAAGTLAIMAVATIKYGFHDAFYSFMAFTAICAALFASLYMRVPKQSVWGAKP